MKAPCVLVAAVVMAMAAGCQSPPKTVEASPTGDLTQWRVEQMPGGQVTTKDGALIIEDAGGCTVWLKRELRAPVEISYDATVVAAGGAHDRVSDLNCFWMAIQGRERHSSYDGRQGFTVYDLPAPRSGKFSDYDSLLTYYVGYGGNENSTTRFRRYNGTANRPLLPEHDLKEKRFLLEGNRTYHIRLVAKKGVAEYWRDGEKIFSYRDAEPLTAGWFGIRTVKSHLEIRNLQIKNQ